MKSLQPREIITYIGYMVSYLVVALSFLIFSFAFINTLFPEMGYYSGLGYDDVFGSLGVFTVAGIIFLIMVYTVIRLVREDATHPESRPRVWILSIGKFLGWVTLAITAMVLVRYFFLGEVTPRFLLKIGLVLVVGIDAVFFFRHEMTRVKTTPQWISTGASLGAVLVIILSIIGTFTYLGTPRQVRTIRQDEQRITDLQNLQSQITSWYQSHEALPEHLSVLKQVSFMTEPRDPNYLQGATYQYRIQDAKKLTYQLCATFATSSDEKFVVRKDRATQGIAYPYPVAGMVREVSAPAEPFSSSSLENPWHHPAGDFCFPLSIDTHLYPPFTSPKN